MSGSGERMTGRDCAGDVAAYVLRALDQHETQAFQAHLQECVVCRDEVQALGPVADSLAETAPQYHVPPALQRRVMRTVRSEARARRRARERPSSAWSLPRVSLPQLGLAAAAVAAALVIGITQLGSGGSSVRVLHASVTGIQGQAQLRLSRGSGELVVRNLQPPPAGKIYEVWLKRGNHPPTPTTALFSVTASGSGDVGIPGSMRGVNTVMVTPEPAGGSKVPTRPAVIVASIT